MVRVGAEAVKQAASTGAVANNWVSVVVAVLGIAGLLGTAIAVVLSTRATKTINLLKEHNSALADRNTDYLEEIATLKAHNTEQDAKILFLEERVDGSRKLESIETKIDKLLVAIGGPK